MPTTANTTSILSKEIRCTTGDREVALDITGQCRQFVADAGITDGLLHLWTPHATAGFAVIEVGSRTELDLLNIMREILPMDGPWQQRSGSRGTNRDHVLPALIPPYVSIPVGDGALRVGKYQSIRLVDTNRDNAVRTVHLTLLG
jgi:secondary thiamine-phosphate synthase enzyme